MIRFQQPEGQPFDRRDRQLLFKLYRMAMEHMRGADTPAEKLEAQEEIETALMTVCITLLGIRLGYSKATMDGLGELINDVMWDFIEEHK